MSGAGAVVQAAAAQSQGLEASEEGGLGWVEARGQDGASGEWGWGWGWERVGRREGGGHPVTLTTGSSAFGHLSSPLLRPPSLQSATESWQGFFLEPCNSLAVL